MGGAFSIAQGGRGPGGPGRGPPFLSPWQRRGRTSALQVGFLQPGRVLSFVAR